jgi:hypothetical protein
MLKSLAFFWMKEAKWDVQSKAGWTDLKAVFKLVKKKVVLEPGQINKYV